MHTVYKCCHSSNIISNNKLHVPQGQKTVTVNAFCNNAISAVLVLYISEIITTMHSGITPICNKKIAASGIQCIAKSTRWRWTSCYNIPQNLCQHI